MTDAMLEALDRHAAWLAGYDLGHAHGRAHERALIDQEGRSRVAGAIVLELSSWPVRDPLVTRAAAVARAARWAR